MLIGYEMQWTVKYFSHQAGRWDQCRVMAGVLGNDGAITYAARKAEMWQELAKSSRNIFKRANTDYHIVNNI